MAVLVAGDVRQAAEGVDDAMEAAVVLEGTTSSKGGDGCVDEAGVEGGDIVVAETPSFHEAGGEVFQNDVRVGGESAGDIPALLRAEVDGDGALAHAEGVVCAGAVHAGDLVGERRRVAEIGGVLAAFDLDDVRAEGG